jgi:hypothetical protein
MLEPDRPKEIVVRHPHVVSKDIAAVLLGAAWLMVASLAVFARQAPPGQPAPPPRPLVPTTASSVLLDPQSHIGANVSMMATVDAILSKTAFTVDQDRTKNGPALLVLAPTLTAAPMVNDYVTVTGDVLKFDPAEIAKRAKAYTIDLPPELVSKYQGQPVVLAAAVVDPKLIDLARRVPPPMSPAELAFQKAMRTINPTFMQLRGGLASPEAAKIQEQAGVLKTAFAEIETYFKSRSVADATGWAADAIKHSTAMEQGAAAGKWDEVKSASGSLQQLCSTCHNAYRERQDDGSFRIRSGG